jgi:plasmid stability protein
VPVPVAWAEGCGVALLASNPANQYTEHVKVTFDLDQDLYRTVKVEAARADRSVREIVEEALGAWLQAAEEAEDRASAAAALLEYRRDGGEAAEAWFGRLAAETHATYTTDEG